MSKELQKIAAALVIGGALAGCGGETPQVTPTIPLPTRRPTMTVIPEAQPTVFPTPTVEGTRTEPGETKDSDRQWLLSIMKDAYPEILDHAPKCTASPFNIESNPGVVINCTDRLINPNAVGAIFQTTAMLPSIIGNNNPYIFPDGREITFSVHPRNPGIYFMFIIGEHAPSPSSWGEKISSEAASTKLFLEKYGIYASFIRYSSRGFGSAAETPDEHATNLLITESCQVQATPGVTIQGTKEEATRRANLMQEIFCNSVEYAVYSRKYGRSYEAYRDFALKVPPIGPNPNESYSIYVFTEAQYNSLPDIVYENLTEDRNQGSTYEKRPKSKGLKVKPFSWS